MSPRKLRVIPHSSHTVIENLEDALMRGVVCRRVETMDSFLFLQADHNSFSELAVGVVCGVYVIRRVLPFCNALQR
jgi:hypothetical protein